jgi:hypothetical protein
MSHVSLILQNTQRSTDRFARSILESVCRSIDRSMYLLYQILDRINLSTKATTKLRPKNTNDQYRPKILEFKAFCRLKYAGEGETIVTLEKVHKFLFYQAYRQKRKRMKGQERMIDHDGSKAKKGMFLYRSYVCSLNVLCGTILVSLSRNAPCIYF